MKTRAATAWLPARFREAGKEMEASETTAHDEPAEIRFFIGRAFDAMADVVRRLGDDRVNDRLPVPGSNSAYVIVTHCVGVCEYWCGHVLAGREVERDRDSEFVARGTAGELLERIAEVADRIDRDLASVRWGEEPVRRQPARSYDPLGRELTQRSVLLHVLEELATHRGHLEVTVDAVTAGLAG
jgi:hypothetical protein